MRSMTGYGQARREGDGWVTQVEVRSVNGRYFKLSARVPHEFGAFERDFEKRIRRRIVRGSVDLTVKVELTGERAARPLNVHALAAYVRSLQELGRELNVPVALTADALASLPGVLDAEELREEEAKALVGHITAALDAALDEADKMRQAEGANLRAELLARCEAIERLVAEVDAAQPAALEEHQRRLVERVNRLLQNTGVAAGEQDVAREVAIFADRSNVSEEIARLRSHAGQLREALGQAEPVGRRLEFIAQELQREANTIGAKLAGASLSRQIVALHGEVDSIREQVLNVE